MATTTLPTPTATTLGGVYSKIADAGYCVTGVDTSGRLVIQPFPMMKTSCCDGNSGGSGGGGTLTGPFPIAILSAPPTATTAGEEGELVYESLHGGLYIYHGGLWYNVTGTGNTNGGNLNGPTVIPPTNGKPTQPGTVSGETQWDPATGILWIWNGTEWQDAHQTYTPNSPAPVAVVDALPATGKEGDVVLLTTDNQLYIYTSGKWIAAQAAYTPDATEAIVIVDTLPALPNTNYPPGAVVYSRADGAVFTNVSGVWEDMTHTMTPTAPDAVHTVSSLPTLPNASYPIGAVVMNLADNKLYKNTSGAWVLIPMQADIAANSITAYHIAANAIGTEELAANAITSDKIGANQITAGKIAAGVITTNELAANSVSAGKIAANAVTAGTVAAGAIGTTQLQASAVTADKIAAGSIVAGSAIISDAAITTLKIGGNAVTIPQVKETQSFITGMSSTLTEIISDTINFPYQGRLLASFSCQHRYMNPAAPPQVLIQLYINGSLVGGAWCPANDKEYGYVCEGMMDVPAGTHKVSVKFSGDSTTEPGWFTLTSFGCMR